MALRMVTRTFWEFRSEDCHLAESLDGCLFEEARKIKALLNIPLQAKQDLLSSVIPVVAVEGNDGVAADSHVILNGNLDNITVAETKEVCLQDLHSGVVPVAAVVDVQGIVDSDVTDDDIAGSEADHDDDDDLAVPEGALSYVCNSCFMYLLNIVIWRVMKSAASQSREIPLHMAAQRYAHNVRPFGPKGSWCFLPLEPQDFQNLSYTIYSDKHAWERFEKFAGKERKGKHSEVQWKEYYVIAEEGESFTFPFAMEVMWSGFLRKALLDG